MANSVLSLEGLAAGREGSAENTPNIVVKSSVSCGPSHRTEVKENLKYEVTFEWYFEIEFAGQRRDSRQLRQLV